MAIHYKRSHGIFKKITSTFNLKEFSFSETSSFENIQQILFSACMCRDKFACVGVKLMMSTCDFKNISSLHSSEVFSKAAKEVFKVNRKFFLS